MIWNRELDDSCLPQVELKPKNNPIVIEAGRMRLDFSPDNRNLEYGVQAT